MATGYITARREARDVRDAEIVRLRGEGLTYDAIAETMGIASRTAWLALNPYGKLRHRRKHAQNPPVDRKCASPLCTVIIPASAKADRLYHSAECRHRTNYLRKIGAVA